MRCCGCVLDHLAVPQLWHGVLNHPTWPNKHLQAEVAYTHFTGTKLFIQPKSEETRKTTTQRKRASDKKAVDSHKSLFNFKLFSVSILLHRWYWFENLFASNATVVILCNCRNHQLSRKCTIDNKKTSIAHQGIVLSVEKYLNGQSNSLYIKQNIHLPSMLTSGEWNLFTLVAFSLRDKFGNYQVQTEITFQIKGTIKTTGAGLLDSTAFKVKWDGFQK